MLISNTIFGMIDTVNGEFFMIKKFKIKPRSRIRKRSPNHSQYSGPYIRIVDATGVDVKRILVGQKNVAASFGESDYFWVDYLAYKNDQTYLMFSKGLYLSTSDEFGNSLGLVSVSNGNTYYIESDVFGDSIAVETTSAPSEFVFHNNKSDDKVVSIYRDGMITGTTTVNAGDSFSFSYNKSFWFYATDVLTGSISWSDVNTQISFLGVYSADAVLTLSDGNYVWTLSNIVSS